MSKPLKVIGTIAGAAALVAGTIATAGIGSAAFVALAAKVATVSSIIATGAQIGSQALAKPPPARGTISQIRIDPDSPQPYIMGTSYFGGVMRDDIGYGATLDDVPNPYRFMPVVYSGGGPVESITPQVDFSGVGSWYSGFLYTDTQLGTCPEVDALAPQWAGAPGWGSSNKLSGQAAIGWSFKFDKDGKRFASGLPLLGASVAGVKVYDPRLDDTQPGGVGAHRLGDETTYEYSTNPALHAGTYAFGRYQNGTRTIGMGLPADGIDWATLAAWANVCDANSWGISGVAFEPGDRWANLKDICFAGGAEPVAGGTLTFKYSAPVVALDTITIDDLTDDNRSITGMQPFRDRINTVIPKYRSPNHNWEMVDAEPVVNSTFLTEDGEEKREVWPFNFVTGVTQASELAAYRMYDSRELPFTVTCKPHMRLYRPGECLHIQDEELGLDITAIILRRQIDPATMKVTFEMITETAAKHAYCLGQTGIEPPTPAIGQTAQERDELAAANGLPPGLSTLKLSGSYTRGLAGNVTQVHDGAGTGTVTVTIPDHTRVYADGTEAAIIGTMLVLDEATSHLLSYDDAAFAGGELGVDFPVVELIAGVDPAGEAYFSAAHPARHFLCAVNTVDEAGSGGSTGGSSPPGGGGWNDDPDYQVP